MTKAGLRKIYLEKREALSEGDYFRFNSRLCDLFFSYTDLSFVRVLHIFLPMARKKEPDTWLLIDRLRREFPQIQLSIPKMKPETNQLENLNFEGLHQVRENSLGIPEPLEGVPTSIAEIDMVLVPLVIFDETGNRVGYGKGYYDRFLAECRSDCRKVGLSFFAPVAEISDVNNFDQKLDMAITPERVFTF